MGLEGLTLPEIRCLVEKGPTCEIAFPAGWDMYHACNPRDFFLSPIGTL